MYLAVHLPDSYELSLRKNVVETQTSDLRNFSIDCDNWQLDMQDWHVNIYLTDVSAVFAYL